MTIKKMIPTMVLVLGLAWAGLLSMPGYILSAPLQEVPPSGAKSAESKTHPLTDNNGKTIGTITTTHHGTTYTQTYDYNVGEYKGTTRTKTFNSKNEEIGETIKFPDGRIVTSRKDVDGGTTGTSTWNDGSVQTTKWAADGKVVSTTLSYPNGQVATTTYDASGKPALLTLKDKEGNVTTGFPDGKGGFTSVVKGEQGTVSTKTFDGGGKLTSETVKDKNGNVVSTTTTTYDSKGGFTSVTRDKKGNVVTTTADGKGNSTSVTKDKNGKVVRTTTVTPDGKGGLTSVTKDKNGKVVSTTVYDKDGKIVSQSGKKPTLASGEGDSSGGGKKAISGSGLIQDKPDVLKAAVPDQNKMSRDKMRSSGTDWSSNASSGSGNRPEKLMKQNTDWTSTKASSGSGVSQQKVLKQNTDWTSTKASSGSSDRTKALQMNNRRR